MFVRTSDKIISNIDISLSHDSNAALFSEHQKSFCDDFCILLNYVWNIAQDLEQLFGYFAVKYLQLYTVLHGIIKQNIHLNTCTFFQAVQRNRKKALEKKEYLKTIKNMVENIKIQNLDLKKTLSTCSGEML